MNICVLFGAGAEMSFGLLGGGEFSQKVIGVDAEGENEAIKTFYKDAKLDSWYPNYTSECKDSLEDEKLTKASIKKKFLMEDKEFSTKTEFEDAVNDVYKNRLNDAQKEECRNKYPSYMGIIDEQFHTLISPKAFGPKKYWRVVSCYWRAYLCLAERMMPDNTSILEIMQNPSEAYNGMLNFANQHKKDESYYTALRSDKQEKNTIQVINMNYTPLCERICGLKESDIAYVHGSFRWFERAKQMEIIDVTSDNSKLEKHDYFPFIFLQSGIKPIVARKQLSEWSKAMGYLDNAEKLVIVGYNFNCDDNHLNSIIREYILNGSNVDYLKYDEKISEDDIYKALRIDETQDNFNIIQIDDNNGIDLFKRSVS